MALCFVLPLRRACLWGIVTESGLPAGLAAVTVSNSCCSVNLSEGSARGRIYEESGEWSV